MENDNKPCCAADALRRIRQVTINGFPTGITMLDETLDEVHQQNLQSDAEIRATLMKRVKVYNYIPCSVEEDYSCVILLEYQKKFTKK